MATSVERNAEKAKSDASHKMGQLCADIDAYVNKYNWHSKSQEKAAEEWDNIQASFVELRQAMLVLENALEIAHDSVNGRFMLTAASDYSDKDVLDLDD